MNLEPGFNPEQGTTAKLSDANLEDNPYLEAVSKEIKDQYMAGEYLLVAPMFKGQKERTVVCLEETGTISIQVNMWAMARRLLLHRAWTVFRYM